MKKGLTLVELLITIVLFALLATAAVYVFRAVLLSWSSQEERTGIDIMLDKSLETLVRNLRGATAVRLGPNLGDDYEEIRFTQGGTDYIFYLYNAGGSYGSPPVFDQDSYELRRTTLSGGIDGTFTYGDGLIIAMDILPPTTSDFSFDGSMVTIDLSAKRGNETVRTRTEVRPRNL